MFLFSFQAPILAKQVAPNVYVTVQQPANGTPEWEKTLLAAVVGALVGIISNIGMEYVKPWIAQQIARKAINVELNSELAANYSKIVTAVKAIEKVEHLAEDRQNYAMSLAETILLDIESDRYEYNFANNKAVVYRIDPKRRLTAFYKALERAQTACEKLNLRLLAASLRMASVQARIYLNENALAVEATKTVFDILMEAEESHKPTENQT